MNLCCNFLLFKLLLSRNALSTANWLPDIGLAQVTHLNGNGWDSFGFTEKSSGKLHLYPEEALFLLETVKNWVILKPLIKD